MCPDLCSWLGSGCPRTGKERVESQAFQRELEWWRYRVRCLLSVPLFLSPLILPRNGGLATGCIINIYHEKISVKQEGGLMI